MDNNRQFVIQKHTTENDIHWDLMIQFQEILWTWRCPVGPDRIRQDPIEIEKISDHSLRFLSYEGPVQQNTGKVKIVDSGICKIISKTSTQIHVKFDGTNTQGLFILQLINDPIWNLTSFP